MERESFSDDGIAQQMNEQFINIKVDREERPDLDELYMKAVQAFTGGRGGWPMTVFLDPTGRPFFGGTYFPPTPQPGLPSFQQVLAHAAQLFAQTDKCREITAEMQAFLTAATQLPTPAKTLESGWLDVVATEADRAFDDEYPGFGGTPRFPPHSGLQCLLAHAERTDDDRCWQMVTATLNAMARGGMYDLLGGGFCRYSTDREWHIPHFEKMLYDNGQLIQLYLRLYALHKNPDHAQIAEKSLDFLLQEMKCPSGAFAASLDADSEQGEGRYYCWTPAEIHAVVGEADGARMCALLNISAAGNFEHGQSVPQLRVPRSDLSAEERETLQRCIPFLHAHRNTRQMPERDDKIITAWNAMAISALAKGAVVLGRPHYREAAVTAATFILQTMVITGEDGEPRLLRTTPSASAPLLAYADDYALLLTALLDVYEATFELQWLEAANRLANRMLTLFWDAQDGGLFYTGADAEQLVARSKNFIGGAEPSANEVAALAFVRLARLCGRNDLEDHADVIIRSYTELMERAPRALGAVAIAADWHSDRSSQEVAIVANLEDAGPMLDVLRAHPSPFRVVTVVPPALLGDNIPHPLFPWLSGNTADNGQPTAHLCQGHICKLPTTEPEQLRQQLLDANHPVASRRKRAPRVHAPQLPADPARWLNTTTPLSLTDLRGHIVVLDFWTHCCINCLHMLPEMEALEQRFADQPVQVIGVHAAKFPAEKNRDNVAHALKRHGVHHPVLLDPDHEVWSQYTVRAWPTIIILDHTGRIAWQRSGETDQHTLAATIERLLAAGRKANELATTAATTPPSTQTTTGRLRHPGKLSVYPSPLVQTAEGVNPFETDTRMYLADSGHHRIVEFRIERGPFGWPVAQQLRTFGSGVAGFSDGGTTQAQFQYPQGTSRSGNTLWVADTGNHAIRAIDLNTGTVRTVAGTGQRGDGRTPAGMPPLQTSLRSPWDIEAASNGSDATIVLISMAGSHQIWILFPERNQITPFIGSGTEEHIDGPPKQAALAQPSGMILAGPYLFFADSETSSIRAYQMDVRQVSTLVGQGLFDFGDQDGQGETVRLQHPLDLTFGEHELYITDTFNNKIKTLRLRDGFVSTLAGNGRPEQLHEPGGIDRVGPFLLVADTNNHRIRVVHRRSGEMRDLTITG